MDSRGRGRRLSENMKDELNRQKTLWCLWWKGEEEKEEGHRGDKW